MLRSEQAPPCSDWGPCTPPLPPPTCLAPLPGPAERVESRNVLDAFFLGRALAEVLNERLGAALGDALATFGKADAELRQALRELQEEVVARAAADMGGAVGGAAGAAADLPPPDLPELVDDLRAEVAATRAVVQQLRQRQLANGSSK